MLKQNLKLLILFLFLAASIPAARADKFSSAVSSDYMTQDLNQGLKNKPTFQKITAVVSTPTTQQTTVTTPSFEPQPVATIGTQIPPVQEDLPGSVPSLSGIPTIKQLNIKVPEYERRFQEMQKANEIKALKKKKKLFESLLEEVMRYGIHLTLAFVLLAVLYALHKDKIAPKAPPTGKPEETGKKTIWDDEF